MVLPPYYIQLLDFTNFQKKFCLNVWTKGAAMSGMDSIMYVVCFDVTSRTITPIAREALINLIMKNCKWEQLNWAERMFKSQDGRLPLVDGGGQRGQPDGPYREGVADLPLSRHRHPRLCWC